MQPEADAYQSPWAPPKLPASIQERRRLLQQSELQTQKFVLSAKPTPPKPHRKSEAVTIAGSGVTVLKSTGRPPPKPARTHHKLAPLPTAPAVPSDPITAAAGPSTTEQSPPIPAPPGSDGTAALNVNALANRVLHALTLSLSPGAATDRPRNQPAPAPSTHLPATARVAPVQAPRVATLRASHARDLVRIGGQIFRHHNTQRTLEPTEAQLPATSQRLLQQMRLYRPKLLQPLPPTTLAPNASPSTSAVK
jgi:hypothetical protein